MLEKIFDMENPLMRALSVVADLIILNVLFVICSIPVITWGASFAALNDVVWHLVRNEEGYIARSFLRSFAGNFKRGSWMGMLFLLIGIVLVVDIYAMRQVLFPLQVVFFALALLLVLIMILSFALLSRYENTIIGTLKNAVSVMIGFFPFCFGMLCCTLGFAAIIALFWNRLLPLLPLLGISLPCYVNALFYVRIFERLDGKQEEPSEV